jgi:hypothetical protein
MIFNSLLAKHYRAGAWRISILVIADVAGRQFRLLFSRFQQMPQSLFSMVVVWLVLGLGLGLATLYFWQP